MNRVFALLVLLACTVLGPGAHGQAQLASPAVTQQKPPPPSASPEEIRALAQSLNDPDARAKLVRQLDLLARAQSAEKPPELESLGSRVLRFLSGQVATASEEFVALGKAFTGLPAAERWVERQIADPTRRQHWIELFGALAIVLAAAAATLWLAELAIGRPRRAIENHAVSGAFSRFILAVMRLLLRLVPIGVAGAAAFSLLSLFNLPPLVDVATVTILNAVILILLIVAISRFFLAPRVAALRLLPFGDRDAAFLHRRVSAVGGIIALGWFGISAARIFGLPKVAADAAFKLVGVVVLVLAIHAILHLRRGVARWICGRSGEVADLPVDDGRWGIVSIRRQLADIWHLLVVAYIVILFAIWVLELEGGFDYVARGTVVSVLIILVARLAEHIARGAVEHALAPAGDSEARPPRIQERFGRYKPIARATISSAIWLAALLAVVDIWGVETFDWFSTPYGHVVTAKAITIVFVIVSATVAWEFVSGLIERYLVGAMRDGTPLERSQRVRTLLPLLRNAFLIFLVVVVVLIVLSEIGLDIAPLLAGAGVVGLAIGFGAQTLVKDIITGIFILFENTIAVGDVIDVGSGHAGVVENVSIRTIKLRDTAGSVHTVPFSNVTSVVNLTKDFAFYVFNLKVDYAQDTDRIVELVRDLGAALEAEPAFGALMVAPVEIFGVDSFGSDGVVVQGRFKTRPGKQWTVGREFNRRLKRRFDALKIPLSFPREVVVRGENAGAGTMGIAPPDPTYNSSASITETATS